MSALSNDAKVTVLLADYAAIDASGKVNALGVNFNLAGIDQRTGMTAPQHVVVLIEVPLKKYQGVEFTVSIELRRSDTGQAVTIMQPTGQSEALRFQQVARAEGPQIPPGLATPEGMMSKVQMLCNFPTGLQLIGGLTYDWRVEIDGQHKKEWGTRFHLLAPHPTVFGGPAAPPSDDMPPDPGDT